MSWVVWVPIWSARGRGARGEHQRSSRPGPGTAIAHSSARMPPIDPPRTAANRVDAELVGQPRLDAHLVADGDPRKARPHGGRPAPTTTARSCPGSRRARSPRPRTSARCRARAPGPTSAVPPARRRLARAGRAGDVRVAGQRVLDQHGVGDGAVRVAARLAPRLVGDPDDGQPARRARGRAAPSVGEPRARRPGSPLRARHRVTGGSRLGGTEPASRSARMSLMFSRPTASRTRPGRHAGRQLLLRGELRVRGRGRVDHQAAHVADVGDVAVQLERLDEALAGLDARRRSRRPARRRRRAARTSAPARATGSTAGPA